MRGAISFLTKLPLGNVPIIKTAKHSYLFPLVGVLIGLIVYIVAFLIFKIIIVPGVQAVIVVITIYALTGLIHLDGLADFSDGVMASGDKYKKIQAMKDEKIGIGGVFSVAVVILITVLAIINLPLHASYERFQLPMYNFFASIMLAEISAKLSMNTCMAFGKKLNQGIGSVFIDNFSYGKFCISIGIAFLISLILFFPALKFLVILTGIIVGVIVTRMANKNFGGVNGDAMGAANEITRCSTLVILCIL